MGTYYRIQRADLDPSDLIGRHHTSYLWTGVHIIECPSCHGFGDDIDGRICSTCRGSGEYDDSARSGVSCCRSREAVVEYMTSRHATLDDHVIVELEGELSDDDDWDADDGAVLVHPERIISVERIR